MNQQRGAGISQVVDSDRGELGPLEGRAPDTPAEVGSSKGTAARGREHQVSWARAPWVSATSTRLALT